MEIEEAIRAAHEHHRAGREELAEDLYRRILKIQPENAAVYNDLGNLFQEREQLDEAIACYQKAIELNPECAGAHYNLGEVMHGQGRLDDARTCYQNTIRLMPDFTGAYYNLGVILQETGQVDEALSCYKKALELDPQHADLYNNIGILYQEKGFSDEAIGYFQKTLEYAPDHFDALNNLGVIFYAKRQFDEALECYQRALEIYPTSPRIYTFMGILSQNKGDVDTAAAFFRKALQYNPNIHGQQTQFSTLLRDAQTVDQVIRNHAKTQRLKILISVSAYNRKKITQLSLAQTMRYRTPSSCHVQVYNDQSTEYGSAFLVPYADEVIQLPAKMGIHALRWHQFRKFMDSDFDLLYLTDNDVIHDPQYIRVIEALYEIGSRSLPVCLYNSIYHMQPETILCCRNGLMLKKTAPGISMLLDRKMVGKILSARDAAGEHQTLSWDYAATEYLGLPWITPETSFLEHFGAGGIHNDDYNRDRALYPTPYLQERRDSLLQYLQHDIEVTISF